MEGVFSRTAAQQCWLSWCCITGQTPALTCADVVTDMQPCMTALNGTSSTLTSECCSGLATVHVSVVPQLGNQSTYRCIESSFLSALPQASIAAKLFFNIQNECNVILGFNIFNPGSC